MVTLVEHKTVAKYIGMSDDTKPTAVSDTVGMPNGSCFIEMDTEKKYFWNADALEWVELPESESGGGGEAGLIDKNIDANGTYNALDDAADGYKQVVVAVPNSYGTSDEGKVVSNGALVAQRSASYTSNGTYDTTLVDEVEVNVPIVDLFMAGSPIGKITTDTTTSLVIATIRSEVTEVDAPNASSVATGVFNGWSSLKKVHIPNVTNLYGEKTFYNCSKLAMFVAPKMRETQTFNADTFYNCVYMTHFDSRAGVFKTNAFYNCGALGTVILRNNSETQIESDALYHTPFDVNRAGGKLYVPSAQVDAYTADANWSALMSANTKNKILPIEGSIYETKYADGTPVSA